MKFKDLKFKDSEITGGVQAFVEINGYEISVVRHYGSYGGLKGFFEIGVFRGGTNEMVDPLDWGDTVKGWLLPSEVEQQLDLIKDTTPCL